MKIPNKTRTIVENDFMIVIVVVDIDDWSIFITSIVDVIVKNEINIILIICTMFNELQFFTTSVNLTFFWFKYMKYIHTKIAINNVFNNKKL